jgi:chromosome partitioning protein
MQVIVFASQKGGSGKTTLTGHLAVQAGLAGYGPVGLIDTDPQGSLSGWWKQRNEPFPSLIQSTAEEIDDDLIALRDQGHQLVMVDTPPSATAAISEIVRVADLVVVPCRPSPHDLRAVGATVDIVERWNKPLVFAVNSATRRARITAEAAIALSQHGTVAPGCLHHRVDFAASMIDGRTVVEAAPESASAKEVAGLWDYVAERLNRQAWTNRADVVEIVQPDNLAGMPAQANVDATLPPSAVEPAVQIENRFVPRTAPGMPARPVFGRRAGGDIG